MTTTPANSTLTSTLLRVPSLRAATLATATVVALCAGVTGCMKKVDREPVTESTYLDNDGQPGRARPAEQPRGMFGKTAPAPANTGPKNADFLGGETDFETREYHPAEYVGVSDAGPTVMYQGDNGAAIVTPAPATPKVNAFGEFGGPNSPQLDGNGKAGFQQHTYIDEGFDADISVSPDGKWMVYASTRHSPRSDIYLQRTDGLAVTKLTSDPADDAFPTFSPDGTKIAFASNRTGSWDIYTMDLDGKNVTVVTRGPAHDLHPSFNPTGDQIAYCRIGGRSRQWEIWTADLFSGERTMVGFGLFPSWSPRLDKDVISFQRARQRGGRWFSLWTMELVQGEPTNVTEVLMSTNAAIIAPSWSPSGHKIAFATVVDPNATTPDQGGITGQDIWTISADGTERQRITDSKGTYATPFWASDGRIYFISNRGGTECVWSTLANGIDYAQNVLDIGPYQGPMRVPTPADRPAPRQVAPQVVNVNPEPISMAPVEVAPVAQAPTTQPGTAQPTGPAVAETPAATPPAPKKPDPRMHPEHKPFKKSANPLDPQVAETDDGVIGSGTYGR